jgi:hypothetical protein
VGRWKQIIRENRFYHLCSRRELGDEYHYIFECTEFINERKLGINQRNIQQSKHNKNKDQTTETRSTKTVGETFLKV